MDELSGRVGIIVGCGSGIGAAAALAVAARGASVVLASRDQEALARLRARIDSLGGNSIVVAADVRRRGELEATVAKAVVTYGGLDFAVNNAGVQGRPTPLGDQREEEYDRILDVNLKGVWRAMRAQIPALLDRGGGAIVNVASVGGIVAAAGIGPYCASKHGVIGLSKSAALDYAAANVRVNVVAPGAIDTAMFNEWMETSAERQAMEKLHPLGRIGAPEEVGSVIAWLCSDSSSFMTGAVVTVDGGYTAR